VLWEYVPSLHSAVAPAGTVSVAERVVARVPLSAAFVESDVNQALTPP
jgi:hypothetical protein